MKLTEKIIKEFEEKSKILFTRGGLAVLLDYPPHDMILDEEEVKIPPLLFPPSRHRSDRSCEVGRKGH